MLFLSLILRLPGISYGLPYHLYGDEEVNVYSALKMLELKTVLPVLHQDEFVPLMYEPPVTAYVYAAAFVPVIAFEYVASGAPSLSEFKDSLVLDPSIFWYVARTIGVLFSLASIFLVFLIGKRIFKSEVAGLLSAFFMATSFVDVSIAATARHWQPGIFFGLLSLWSVIIAFDREKVARFRYLAFAGVSSGLAVGTVYVALLAPITTFLVPFLTASSVGWRKFFCKESILNLFVFFLPCVFVAGMLILAHPYPLFAQAMNSAGATSAKSLGEFFSYYAHALWNYETPLLVFSLLGFGWLLVLRKHLVLIFALFFVSAAAVMYALFPNIVRYLVSLVPALSLLAGFGLYQLFCVREKYRYIVVLMCAVLAVYMVLLFGRYESLILQNDTRVAVRTWVYEHVPENATIIVDSDLVKFPGTVEALSAQKRNAPETLRAADRALLSGAKSERQFNAYQLLSTSTASRAALVSEALKRGGETYFIQDAWAPPSMYDPEFEKEPIVTFATGASTKFSQLIQGGQPIQKIETHLLGHIYTLRSFGPDVTIYSILGRPNVDKSYER
ncbi:glycosyltransferase family 39 protein [Patescibacteria group bacterium]|nr:glycosyltransferase family 39 protein [Patescibacteria group bacterium]